MHLTLDLIASVTLFLGSSFIRTLLSSSAIDEECRPIIDGIIYSLRNLCPSQNIFVVL